MTTPVKNKALEIHAWCAKLDVKAQENQEMVKDYIDRRWPDLTRGVRQKIFEAAMKT